MKLVRNVRTIRNFAAACFFGTVLWAAHPARADYVDPWDGDAWCPAGYHILKEYQGLHGSWGDPYPACDGCCPGDPISAEEWCANEDHGDYVVNNEYATTCTCCKLNSPGGG